MRVSVAELTVNYLVNPLGIDDPEPALGWRLRSAEHAVLQSAYQVRAASTAESLGQPDLWDSGRVASDRQVDVAYGGEPLTSRRRVFWQARVWTGDHRPSAWSPVGCWEMGLLDAADWTATWIADPAAEDALPIFARNFTVAPNRPIERARLYVSGLGLYEARLNGEKVGADFLTPSTTDYRRRALYKTYDVTRQVRVGDNRLGIMVGNGFFNVPEKAGRYWESVTWKDGVLNGRPIHLSGEPKVIAQLEITCRDGRVQHVSSDSSWRVDDGPIEFSGYYGGEDYDARKWQPGWDRPDGDLSRWRHARTASSTPAVLSAQFEPPVVETERLKPVAVREPEPGVYVFDFGTCFVGWPEITVEGPSGTRIAMRPGWYVDDDGMVTQDGMVGWVSDAAVVDHYTLAGAGVEVWHARFSYHGFRYVEVRGLPTRPPSVTGIVLRAANDETLGFSSSSQLLTDIRRVADRSMRSAMLAPTMPTDPNREKAGWQGDRGVALGGGVHAYDFASYNQALLRDVFDEQRADGSVPGIVPDPTDFWYVGDLNWSGAPIMQAYESYRLYGDSAVLRRYYPKMRRYFAYLESREEEGGTYPGGDTAEGYFGDWMYPGQHWQNPFDQDNANFTPPELTVTWAYWKLATAMAGTARALGHREHALSYTSKADAITSAFHRTFFDPGTRVYAPGSQAASALALDMGAPPADLRDQMLDHLVDNIRNAGNHLNVGMIGLPALVRVLTAEDRGDVLYDAAVQTSFPSYGYWLSHGATSLPESWAWRDREGVPDLNILSGLDPWFTRGLAGIQQAADAVAFDKIVIAPAVVGSLTTVTGSLRTVRGEIISNWQRDETALTMEISIPANSTATVVVPLLTRNAEVTATSGAQLTSRDEKHATYTTGSGTWTFTQP